MVCFLYSPETGTLNSIKWSSLEQVSHEGSDQIMSKEQKIPTALLCGLPMERHPSQLETSGLNQTWSLAPKDMTDGSYKVVPVYACKCVFTSIHLNAALGHTVIGDAHRDHTDIRDRPVFDELSDMSQPLATSSRVGWHTNT